MTSKPTTAKIVLRITSFILHLLLNIIFYVVVITLITSASKKTYDFCYQVFGQVTASEAPGRDVKIKIKDGESTMNVASKLELNRVIRNKYSFYAKAKLKKYVIMPGTFVVNTSMTYDEIFAIITVPSKEEEKSTDKKTEGTNQTGQSRRSDTKDLTNSSDEESIASDSKKASDDENSTDKANNAESAD
jgi:UPF0755 protein